METVYTIITLNGKAYAFSADELVEYDGTYVFYLEDEKVAEFKRDALAGYFITRYEDEDTQDYD